VSVWVIVVVMTFILSDGEDVDLVSKWTIKQFPSEEICIQHFEPALKDFQEELQSGRMKEILKQHGLLDKTPEKVEMKCFELQRGRPV
jgi:hypothetical protein